MRFFVIALFALLCGRVEAQKMAFAYNHTLMVKNDGTVWACGYNDRGALGDGSFTDRLTPVQAAGLTNVVAVAAGGFHSIFLKSDGTVWAAGDNIVGALGDGTLVNRNTAVQVTGLTDIVAIAAGTNHSLFLKSDGTVWGCGQNDYGQLGLGATSVVTVPVQIPGLANIVSIAAGYFHSAFCRSDGTVWACGFNDDGMVGDNTLVNKTSPVQMTGVTDAHKVSCGSDHTIILRSDGTVWGTGNNQHGQLGTGAAIQQMTAVPIVGASGVTAAVSGNSFNLFLKADSTVWGNGSSSFGQLAGGDTVSYNVTVTQLPGLTGISEVAAGTLHSLFLRRGCEVLACGRNTYGEMGDGTLLPRYTPVSIQELCVLPPAPTAVVKPLSVGRYSSIVRRNDGTVWGCGENSHGAMGDGTTVSHTAYLQVPGMSGVVQSASGMHFTLFLKSDGTVWATGHNENGQLGDGTNTSRSTAAQIAGLSGIIDISAGDFHSLFLKDDGTVWACGYNISGQLGDGTTVNRNIPVQVSGLSGITAIDGGQSHSLFLKNDGTVWACGQNGSGQLGDGSNTDRSTVVQVTGMTGITAVSAGGRHSLLRKNDGTVWAFGSNTSGQLGDGTATSRNLAVQMSGVASITAISAGGFHSTVLKSDGTVWACGINADGQLGDGTTTMRMNAVQVAGMTGVTHIAAGAYNTLFLKGDCSVWACGDNVNSHLGDGTTIDQPTPVRVFAVCPLSCSIDVNDFAVSSASSECQGAASTVTISSTTLTSGATYRANYTLSGPAGNVGSYTSPAFAYGVNTGIFSIDPAFLANAGATTITVNYLTEGGGCSSAAIASNNTASFMVYPLPVISGATTVVAGTSTILSSNMVSGTWSTSTSTVATINTVSGFLTGVSAGMSVVTYTAVGGCLSSYTVIITPAGTATNVCQGQSITLSNGGYPDGYFTASPAGILYMNTSTGVTTGANPGTAVVTYHYFSVPTSGVITHTVTVNPLSPTIGFNTVCERTVSVFTNTTPGGGTWSSSNSSVLVSMGGGDFLGNSPGIAELYFTTSAGCIYTRTVEVLPNALITGPSSVCVGQTITLSASNPSGAWDTNAGATAAVTSTGTVTGVASGWAHVFYVLNNGCYTVADVRINPLSPIVGATSVCSGQTAMLANGTPGGGTWSAGNTAVATVVGGSGLVTGVAGGSSVISFTTTDGCVATRPFTVVESPTISGNSGVCVGRTVSLSSSLTGGAWSSSSGSLAAVSASGVVTGVAAGTPRISYILPGGCMSVATITVSALSPTNGGAASVCAGRSVTYTNTTPGGGLWSSSNTSVAVVAGGVATGIDAGTAVISFSPGAGCAATRTLTVNPAATISGNPAVCTGQFTNLSSSIAGGIWTSSSAAMATVSSAGLVGGVTAGSPRISYILPGGCTSTVTVTVSQLAATNGVKAICMGQSATFTNATAGGGIWSSSNTNILAMAGAVATGTGSGIAVISFTAAGGCVATRTVTVNASATISGVNTVCVGQLTHLSNSLGGGAWSSSSGALATVSSAGVVGGVSAGSPRISYIMAGTGCQSVATVTVMALSPITGGTTGICQSGSMTLANATPFGGVWTSSNTSVATVNPATGFVKGTGPGTVQIMFTANVGGCIATRNLVVNACRESANGMAMVQDMTMPDMLELYPNPNNGSFTVKAGPGTFIDVRYKMVSLEIVNVLGQAVYRNSIPIQQGGVEELVDLGTNVAPGTYMLRMSAGEVQRVIRFVIR